MSIFLLYNRFTTYLIGALLWAAFGQASYAFTFTDSHLLPTGGNSVSISGDTAIISTINHNDVNGYLAGEVDVYVRSDGIWNLQQQLLASDGDRQDLFGFSVSLSGNTAVIGSHGSNSAYVFVRRAGVWNEVQKLTPGDGAGGKNFGVSVSLSRDTMIIGANEGTNENGFRSGASYVFERKNGVWSEQQKLTIGDLGNGKSFGKSVSLDGNTAIISAPASGPAYVFERRAGVWSLQQTLTNSEMVAGDWHGSNSVWISGDTAIVGSMNSGVGSTGAAFVFVRNGRQWSFQQKLIANESTSTFDYFGSTVTISGDTAVIGSIGFWQPYDEYDLPDIYEGTARVFVRRNGVWNQTQKLSSSSHEDFGKSSAMSGDTVVIGSPGRAASSHVFEAIDADGDGVEFGSDKCPDTLWEEAIDRGGCSIAQQVPCGGPAGTMERWKSHRHYVRKIVKVSKNFLRSGLITKQERRQIFRAALRSQCGR